MSSSQSEIPGFELPLYQSLTVQILLMGAPKSLIVANSLIGLLFIIDFHFFWILPLNGIIHILSIYLTKKDAQFFDCLREYIKKKNYYCT